MSEPLPCPFCGRDDALYTDTFFSPEHDDPGWSVGCIRCGLSGLGGHKTEAAAIAAWNVRPRHDALAERARRAEAVISALTDPLSYPPDSPYAERAETWDEYERHAKITDEAIKAWEKTKDAATALPAPPPGGNEERG